MTGKVLRIAQKTTEANNTLKIQRTQGEKVGQTPDFGINSGPHMLTLCVTCWVGVGVQKRAQIAMQVSRISGFYVQQLRDHTARATSIRPRKGVRQLLTKSQTTGQTAYPQISSLVEAAAASAFIVAEAIARVDCKRRLERPESPLQCEAV